MRRTSVVGPLLLIAIGVLFLLRNVYPEVPLMDYLARYWPYLLIVWGALRLVEIAAWATQGKPLPPRGLSGGEWVLIVWLCIIGVGVHTARGLSTWFPRNGIDLGSLDIFGESYDYPVAKEIASPKTPRIVIQSFRGNARIIGADVATVKVSGHNNIRSMDRASADRTNDNSPLEITADGSQITIRPKQSEVFGNQRLTADLDVTVPKGASVEVHGKRGDFEVNNLDGSVEIESDSAGVRMENIGGQVKLDLRNSDVIRALKVKGGLEMKGRGSDLDLQEIGGPVAVSGAFSGVQQFRALASPLHFTNSYTSFNAEKIPGDVRISIGDVDGTNVVGPIRVTSTRSKDIRIADFTNSLEVNVDRGDIDLRPGSLPLAKMEVRTRSGSIELGLPEGAKFDLTATNQRGESYNDFGAPIVQETNRRGNSGVMRGSNGGPSVTLETNRGDIRVRKSLPGEPPPPVKDHPRGFPAAPPAPPVPPVPPVLSPLNQ